MYELYTKRRDQMFEGAEGEVVGDALGLRSNALEGRKEVQMDRG